VQLFDILQNGFHTPLTATQIAELFHAGRLGRHTRCKPVKQSDWRTIDELFPLLKYHTPLQFSYEPPETDDEFRFRRSIVTAICLAAAVVAMAFLYFYYQSQRSLDWRLTANDTQSISAANLPSRHSPVFPAQSTQNTAYASTAFPSYGSNALPVEAQPVEQTNNQATIRLAEAQRIAEQARRDQAVAEQQRAMREQKLLEEQKAAGRDQHVPFDQWQIVNVGGEVLRVKIHDNDVTSFDVWIDYGPRREVNKEKGITHSGTDETLIYSNGRAALYYVWEISGKLNHCLLRVRDA